jgi:hypothetical protein
MTEPEEPRPDQHISLMYRVWVMVSSDPHKLGVRSTPPDPREDRWLEVPMWFAEDLMGFTQKMLPQPSAPLVTPDTTG